MIDRGSKQRHLPAHIWPAEMSSGEGTDVAVQAVFSGEDIECLGDLFGEVASTTAAVGCGAVQLSAGGLADEGFDFPCPIGMHGPLQPVEKQILDLIRQAEQHPRGPAGTSF